MSSIENQKGIFEMLAYHSASEDIRSVAFNDSENIKCISKEYQIEDTKTGHGCKLITDDYLKNINDFSIHAIESFKKFRSYISTVVYNTNNSIAKTAQNLKSVVSKNNFLSNLTITKNPRKIANSEDEVKAPWIGTVDEEEAKKLILSLSENRKLFLRKPPESVFDFNLDEYLPIAKLLLKEDPGLQKIRFELVPKLIKEDSFWRNYFYRIHLIKQSFKISLSKFKSPKSEESFLHENQEDLAKDVDSEIHDCSSNPIGLQKDWKEKEGKSQNDDSFESMLETEIHELNSSLYLVHSSEELEDKDWEKELELMLEESD